MASPISIIFPIHSFRHFLARTHRFATIQNVTDRQTTDDRQTDRQTTYCTIGSTDSTVGQKPQLDVVTLTEAVLTKTHEIQIQATHHTGCDALRSVAVWRRSVPYINNATQCTWKIPV